MSAPQSSKQPPLRAAVSTPSTPPAPKTPSLQERIVGLLARTDIPASTSALRDALAEDPASGQRVVIEPVYAALVALERKRVVRRIAVPEASTRPLWQLRTRGTPGEERRSQAMHTPRARTAPTPGDATCVPALIEDRIARIVIPADAHDVAERILDHGLGQGWQKWKTLVAAPLAGWLYVASQHATDHRVDWILRALPHRPHWSRAARRVEDDPQLCESLRSVSRLGDRPFSDVTWLLVIALRPWSTNSVTRTVSLTAGAR